MKLSKVLIVFFVVIFDLREISGHGKLMEPVNRASAWRKGFNTPENYDDDQNYCGSAGSQHEKYDGKCGICGDDYERKRPRPNENTGKFGLGVIVKKYKEGQVIDVEASFENTHKGFFRFALCPLKHPKELEEEECFIPLKFFDGSDKYEMKNNPPGIYKSKVLLPKGVTCKNCVLRWEYVAGNNWGHCPDGTERVGCGPQETFRTCSDVSIV